MGLMAPAHFGLKGAFGQRCSSKRPRFLLPRMHHRRGRSCVRHVGPTKHL